LIVSAPTSSGKTVLFELAILKYSHLPSPTCLYLAPIKSLCHEKYGQWNVKFRSKMSVLEVTGDTLENGQDQHLLSHIVIGTPEKVDFLSRQSLEYLKKIRLLLIDEVHMLNFEERGATLEAIVSRIMSLNNKIRIIAVSATIPNISEVGEWLKVPKHNICVFGEEYRPVKINKVVLGFKPTGNPFTF
jgi:ATP-dependent DNA helicase HFM1/MER3